jgi:hypothetical protein
MWPDDYIDWAGRIRPAVAQRMKLWLGRRLSTNPQWTASGIENLAEQATRHAFDKANDHRRYSEYVGSEAEFSVWVITVVLNEVLRLLIRHRLGEPRFLLLPAVQRRLLGMRFLDQLPPGDVAAVLRISADQVREEAQQALDAFFQILVEPDEEE